MYSCGTSSDADKIIPDKNSDSAKANTVSSTHKQTDSYRFDLADLKKYKASVFFFLSPDCPLCQSYSPTIRQIDSLYAKDSVKTYAVFPGKMYSDESIKKFFSDYHLNIPYFIDDNFALTDRMRATVTPEAFIVNRNGEVVYGGRIDNWAYEIGKKRTNITEHDLTDALRNFISGKEIKNKTTEAVGCIIEITK